MEFECVKVGWGGGKKKARNYVEKQTLGICTQHPETSGDKGDNIA